MEVKEEIEILLEDLDEENITSILTKWREIVTIRKQLDSFEEMLKNKVRIYLKERSWEKYKDKETNISVSISTQKRQSIDKEQLKIMLTDAQYAMVLKTTTFEKLSIITPEMRKVLRGMVKEKASKR